MVYLYNQFAVNYFYSNILFYHLKGDEKFLPIFPSKL